MKSRCEITYLGPYRMGVFCMIHRQIHMEVNDVEQCNFHGISSLTPCVYLQHECVGLHAFKSIFRRQQWIRIVTHISWQPRSPEQLMLEHAQMTPAKFNTETPSSDPSAHSCLMRKPMVLRYPNLGKHLSESSPHMPTFFAGFPAPACHLPSLSLVVCTSPCWTYPNINTATVDKQSLCLVVPSICRKVIKPI